MTNDASDSSLPSDVFARILSWCRSVQHLQSHVLYDSLKEPFDLSLRCIPPYVVLHFDRVRYPQMGVSLRPGDL